MIAGYSKGDTIIEVLLAITIFSLAAVGGISLMNQGAAMAQRALEIDLVRQQVDSQADALRFLNSEYIAGVSSSSTASRWENMLAKPGVISSAVQEYSKIDEDGRTCAMPTNKFALNLDRLGDGGDMVISSFRQAGTYSRIEAGSAEGIWIQAIEGNVPDGDPTYYDFHIRACWITPGQTAPVKIGTIVRLYAPAS